MNTRFLSGSRAARAAEWRIGRLCRSLAVTRRTGQSRGRTPFYSSATISSKTVRNMSAMDCCAPCPGKGSAARPGQGRGAGTGTARSSGAVANVLGGAAATVAPRSCHVGGHVAQSWCAIATASPPPAVAGLEARTLVDDSRLTAPLLLRVTSRIPTRQRRTWTGIRFRWPCRGGVANAPAHGSSATRAPACARSGVLGDLPATGTSNALRSTS